MTKVRRSIALSAIERYGAYAISLAATASAARLLTPGDFGIFALGATLILLIDVFRDFGASNYLIQVQEVSRDIVRASVTVSFLVSIACAVVLVAAAAPAAWFYDEPRLRDVLLVLASASIVTPFSSASLAMLRRDMAFGTLTAISLGSATINALTLVTLGYLGFGPMALAWAALAGATAHSLAANLVRPMPWAFVPSFNAWRPAFAFGLWSGANAFVNVLHATMPQLIIGRMLGIAQVGLYDRVRIVCQLPDRLIISALNPVLLPALSEHSRRGGSLKEPYLLGLKYLSALQWPAIACLVLLADPIVRLLLGAQWTELPHLVRVTALGMVWLVAAPLNYPTFIALGRVRDALTTSLISMPPSIALIALASLHSLEAVAMAGWITAPLQMMVAVSVIRRHVGFSWTDMLHAVAPGAVAAAGAATGPLVAMALHGFRLDMPVTSLLVAVPVAALGHLAALRLTGHPLYAEIESMAQGFLRRERRAA